MPPPIHSIHLIPSHPRLFIPLPQLLGIHRMPRKMNRTGALLFEGVAEVEGRGVDFVDGYLDLGTF